jgi:hypothetical protein
MDKLCCWKVPTKLVEWTKSQCNRSLQRRVRESKRAWCPTISCLPILASEGGMSAMIRDAIDPKLRVTCLSCLCHHWVAFQWLLYWHYFKMKLVSMIFEVNFVMTIFKHNSWIYILIVLPDSTKWTSILVWIIIKLRHRLCIQVGKKQDYLTYFLIEKITHREYE